MNAPKLVAVRDDAARKVTALLLRELFRGAPLVELDGTEFLWKASGFDSDGRRFVVYGCNAGKCAAEFKGSPAHLVEQLSEHAEAHADAGV